MLIRGQEEAQKRLLDFTRELGFDDFGITSAQAGTPTSEQFKDSIREDLHGPLDYLSRTVEERADVQALMPGAKSVLVVVKNYYTGNHQDFLPKEQLTSRGLVSRYAWGGDYHHWFRKRLRKLRAHILENFGEASRVHIFNDTGPVLERAWAQKAGLGFIGKSSMFIHRRFGTWVFLGGLVTDVELLQTPVYPMPSCGTCTRCMDSCPSKAILAPKVVDAKRCATTWNVERPKDPIAQDFEQKSRWVIGCDTCQEVCPFNKFESKTSEERFYPRLGHVAMDSVPEGDLNGTPLARAGKEGIRITLERLKILN